MNPIAYIFEPVAWIIVVSIWVYCIVDTLRNHRSWWWLGVLVFIPILPTPFYLLNFKLRRDAPDGVLDTALRDSSRMRELQAAVAERDLPSDNLDLGAEYCRLGKYAEALPHLAKAIDAAPGSPSAQFYAGKALVGTGRFDPAIQHLEFVLDFDPKHGEARLVYANALAGTGQSARAFAEYARVSDEFGFPEAAVRHARMLIMRGEIEAARAELRSVLARAGELPKDRLAEHRPWIKAAGQDLRELDAKKP